MATVRLDGVDKVYPNGHVAARDLDLTVRDGELLVLVGPSGCGKSTALRMVAGLETPTSGRVFIGDQDVTDRPPQERDIAMVFQSYALYPHMSVRENLAFGLRMRGTAEGDRDRRVERAARSLGLEPMLDRKPSQLSGGQRQRVALGRATVREPAVFLFDEPLSNLDAKLRVQTRAELARLHRRIAATMIYVTHDQEEAMTLGQRVAVMNDGALEQVAPPMEVYSRPATLFVAGFVGSPAMNFFPCELRDADAAASVGGPLFDLRLEAGAAGGDAAGAHGRAGAAREAAAGDRSRVVLGVRPSDISVGEPAEGDVRARVDVVEPLGSQVLVHLEPEATEGGRGLGADADDRSEVSSEGGETEIRALVEPERTPDVDRTVGLRFRRDRLHLFDAASGRRIANGP